jgi:hypothetical protein
VVTFSLHHRVLNAKQPERPPLSAQQEHAWIPHKSEAHFLSIYSQWMGCIEWLLPKKKPAEIAGLRVKTLVALTGIEPVF